MVDFGREPGCIRSFILEDVADDSAEPYFCYFSAVQGVCRKGSLTDDFEKSQVLACLWERGFLLSWLFL